MLLSAKSGLTFEFLNPVIQDFKNSHRMKVKNNCIRQSSREGKLKFSVAARTGMEKRKRESHAF